MTSEAPTTNHGGTVTASRPTYAELEQVQAEQHRCTACGTPLSEVFADLGMQPPCQAFVSPAISSQMEPFFPLTAYVCPNCFLVQVPSALAPDEIFTDYAYFSSFSTSWLDHASRYTAMVTDRFGLNGDSFVIELASNDGYLLRNFVERGIPCLGVEPALNVAEAARKIGVPTLTEFFGVEVGRKLAADGAYADLMIGNNVLAQCPDLEDFIGGVAEVLKPDGVLTLEFPHLIRLIEGRQFDTIYHEHFYYFSLLTVQALFERHGLRVFDVEELPTHGGSIRVYGCRDTSTAHEATSRVTAMQAEEHAYGLDSIERYQDFQEEVLQAKRSILRFLIDAKESGKRVVGYGAPGKGNTLLNYCGIRTDFLDYLVDLNPVKQGMFAPGSRIPVVGPELLRETEPDYVVIMPWNLKEEIAEQHAYIRDWGGQFVTFLPEVRVLNDAGEWTRP
ncbi:MAG: methyltransferase domain-containing protein [Dehalococcoidia bacterium]|nr:methyltransferase domain-containing protein [Dehalococcoidia bacterium]MCB9491234.1 methyltransferase domain-containing protein [Dehalococcoidia bacterium]